MSADKSVIIGTATDMSSGTPRYILRIYQLVTITANDHNTFTQADLAGTYGFHKLRVATPPLSATGNITIDAIGTVAFSSYTDSNGSTMSPAAFSIAMDAAGNLANGADSSFMGKLSYFKDMFVATRTDSPGVYSLDIALRR